MNWVLLKQTGAAVIGALNLAMLVLAVTAHFRKQMLPKFFNSALTISGVAGLATWAVGMALLFMGLKPHVMHILYGTLVGLGAVAQLLLRSHTAMGQRYLNRPLIYAFIALWCFLLTARAWMQA